MPVRKIRPPLALASLRADLGWTAGVAPSPAGKWLGAETDRAGGVRIQRDLTVAEHPEILVLGSKRPQPPINQLFQAVKA
jgi:hypothetical protein